MFGLSKREKRISDLVGSKVEAAISAMLRDVDNSLSKAQALLNAGVELKTIRDQVETLKIEKLRVTEEFERKEREIEHMVGLERRRQAQELELAKREVSVQAGEEALKADRQRFEDQLKFMATRFEEEGKYQRDLLTQMMARLPSAEIIAKLGDGGRKR